MDGAGNHPKHFCIVDPETVEVDVHRGEFVALAGPSGCGKSTLLTLIGGLKSVQDGVLTVLGCSLWLGSEIRPINILRFRLPAAGHGASRPELKIADQLLWGLLWSRLDLPIAQDHGGSGCTGPAKGCCV
ncbi:MAG: ATP-binding cassette domain-containing protein [Synechococcaceae cyanobacterium ELA263]